jgi:hypothetical protein
MSFILKNKIKFFFSCSLVCGPCTIAIPHLGEPNGPIDSTTVSILQDIGEHILADARVNSLRNHRRPSFFSRVPSYLRHMLGRAYSELFCLDNNCLHMAYLNGTSPMLYPDQAKLDRAAILLATPQLVEMEIDRVSSLAAQQAGQVFGFL